MNASFEDENRRPILEAVAEKYRPREGWFQMACWNGLSVEQQRRLIAVGNLPLGYVPEGECCTNGAEVAVETEADVAPGPRFYCRPCAIDYLSAPPAKRCPAHDIVPGTDLHLSCDLEEGHPPPHVDEWDTRDGHYRMEWTA